MRIRWRQVALGAALAAALGVAIYTSPGILDTYQAGRHFERAQEALAAGRHDSARAELRSVLRLQPAHTEARRRLARLELQLGHREQAFLELLVLTEMHPEDADARRLRAELQGGVDAPDRAERWPGALGELIRSFAAALRQKKWAQARALVRSAQQTYPGTMLGPWLDGLIEYQLGDLNAAEQRFLEALAAAPRSHRVVTNLAVVWSRQRGAAYAGDRLVRLAERDPGFVYPLPIAAAAYVEADQPSRADAAIRRGFDLQPGSPVPYREAARFYLDLDRASEAVAICAQGLERFPQDVELRLQQARGEASLGNREGAIQSYQEAMSLQPDNEAVAAALARLLVAARKDEASRRRALELVQQLESRAPSDPDVLDAMGWVYLTAGSDPRRARSLLEAAANAAPADAGRRFRLAAAYARSGQPELARRELRSALSSGRPFEEEPDARRLLRELGGSEP